jgi:hypothetical protein
MLPFGVFRLRMHANQLSVLLEVVVLLHRRDAGASRRQHRVSA